MRLRNDGWYRADKGKHFVVTSKGKEKCASLSYKEVGAPVSEYDYEAVHWMVDSGYVAEVDIPGWTKLKGYEVVYYLKGCRLHAGNKQTFPTRKVAKTYKKNYEAYPWMDHELTIEEVEYEGVPLSEYKYYNGKEVIDEEHYFGLLAHDVGTYFLAEKVMDFMCALPPAYRKNGIAQMGEPANQVCDENGKLRTTYATFKHVAEDIWEYCGECFLGENINRSAGEKSNV